MGSSVADSMSSDVLDLTNFDSCIHSSPFVLTSPRSLLACRKAKIKPNELLYKSAADISKDLGVSIKLAYPVYQQHEKIRREKLDACRQERNMILSYDITPGVSRKKKKKCTRKELSADMYRNNIASNMRRTKSIQNKLNEDEKNNVRFNARKTKRRCKKSKSVSDLMDLKELCKKVDRIAILERCEPDMTTDASDEQLANGNRSRSRNTTRSLVDVSGGARIPEQDRKILENMRRKRVERQRGEDLAYRVNVFWERMRDEERRLTGEQKQMWHDYIAAKRDAENSANGARLLELRAAFENGQRQLDEQIRRRDSKVAELKRQIEDRKRVMVSNRSEELRHAVRLQRMQERHEDAIRRKFDECQAKERRAFQNHLDKMALRMRELADKSLQREQHTGRVHRVARELEDGMQRWQDRIMLMQYEQLRKARENAALYTDNKKLRAEIDNKRRALEHSTKIQKVKEAENERLQNIKKEIEEEEKKIRRLKQKKCLEIELGRKLALSTAELRNEIRRSTETNLFNQQR